MWAIQGITHLGTIITLLIQQNIAHVSMGSIFKESYTWVAMGYYPLELLSQALKIDIPLPTTE
jgi:hypothetical protein